MTRLILTILSLSFFACTSDQPKEENTPEDVVRRWQKFVDQNQFEEAKKISASRAIELIEDMEAIIEAEPALANETIRTEFVMLSCSEQGTQAICRYVIKEEGEAIQDSFILSQQKGKWLVDLPEEDLEEESILQDIFDAKKE